MKIFLISLLFISSAFAFDHDHKEWDSILKKNTKRVKGQVLVDYKNIDKKTLEQYLKSLSAVSDKEYKAFNKDQKLAFLINAYNSFTFEWILRHYPVKSIKKTVSGWNPFDTPWKQKFIKLLGKKMSLDEIEHGTIRKQFNEARIHFVVNCASIGCPSLLEEAITGAKLDDQLDRATKLFLGNKDKNILNKQPIRVSKIFSWYEEDFVKYHGGVINFVKKYHPEVEGTKFKTLDYDWSLNDY